MCGRDTGDANANSIQESIGIRGMMNERDERGKRGEEKLGEKNRL